jgi:23S rRNA (guanosine2251-2'-O)-methyltransferase
VGGIVFVDHRDHRVLFGKNDREAEGEIPTVSIFQSSNLNSALPDTVIVGRNPVLEALRAGTPLEKIYILYGTHGGSMGKIIRLAKEKGIVCAEVGKEKFQELGGGVAAQGVAAVVGTKRYVDVGDILALAEEKGEKPFVLVVDEIEDPQNLGALIRTAECAGVHGVVIAKHHAASVSSSVVKASAGATEYMQVAKVTNIASCLEQLKKGGVWIVGAAADGDRDYADLDYAMPAALVIGSEEKGMRRLVREKCDFVVKIPLYGKVESLNASVAGALLMYEVVRKRKRG